MSKNKAVTEAIPIDLTSISITKQTEVEPNKEGSAVVGSQKTVPDDILQVYRVTNKKKKMRNS